MKHNTLLLLIFVPILVYQLYYTFRYWKEGLEGDDMPDFCKGKDGKLDAEKWNKKTDESKCKWKGIPEEDENHCISKQREWCEKDCKGKFDHKGGGDWCKDVGSGGKDVSGFPDKEGPQCDSNFIENLVKNCPIEDGVDCKCWEEKKINEALCKLPQNLVDILGGSTTASVFKMKCSKGYNKSDFIQKVMSEGTSPKDAENSWNELSQNGYINSETVKNYILKTLDEGTRKEQDDAERKKAGIGPAPGTEPTNPHSGWYLGKPRESCTDVCKKANKPCNLDRIKAVSTSDEVRKVAKMLGLECDGTKGDGTAEAHKEGKGSAAPFKNTEDKGPWKNTCRYVKKAGDCDAAYHLYSRFCPCGEEPPPSGKAAAVAIKTRNQALASGKTTNEADSDVKSAVAKISDPTTPKDRVQDIIKNIAGGGGSIAAQAIGSHLAKLEADKKAAEAAMEKIPKGEDPPARGDTASGSLGAAPTVPGVSQTTKQPQPSQPLGSNETYNIADKPDNRISWPTSHRSDIKENSNCAAFCGYKTPYCQDIVKGSNLCKNAIRVDTKEDCEKFSKEQGNKCKWQTKEYRPCTKQCKDWGCANCENIPSPPPPPPSGGNTEECVMCRTRGPSSSWCKKCKETCKKNKKYWDGENCIEQLGGCEGTEYGCCPDGKTAKKDLTGFNCRGTPSGKPIEGRFKAWIDQNSGTSFEVSTIKPPQVSGAPPNTAQNPSDLLRTHEKQFHAENHSSKQYDLKGTSLKKVNSEVNKNGWCIPQKNTQGKIISWIAKPNNTQGWSKTDKCLTMDGKEIIFGTGSCLQGQTEDECNLGLVKLQKDKYWHTHPVLLRKVKESGPKATPLGSKYV